MLLPLNWSFDAAQKITKWVWINVVIQFCLVLNLSNNNKLCPGLFYLFNVFKYCCWAKYSVNIQYFMLVGGLLSYCLFHSLSIFFKSFLLCCCVSLLHLNFITSPLIFIFLHNSLPDFIRTDHLDAFIWVIG
jgi:hypothetical protein